MIKAVIFDKDGVIIDVEKIQHQAFVQFLHRFQRNLSFEDYLKYMSGHRVDENFHYLFGNSFNKNKLDTLIKEQYAIYLNKLKKNIPYVPGVRKFLIDLKRRDFLIGLATSSKKEGTSLILDDLKTSVVFDAICLGIEVVRSKPHPAIYLLMAKKLGVDPKNCFVFEDSLAGVEAAKAAGMRIGFVTTSHPAGTVSGVDLTIPDFTHLTTADVL